MKIHQQKISNGKEIKIKKNNLIFRSEAIELQKECEKKLAFSKLVYLNFANVSFVSRSFLDGLLNIIVGEKRIKIINLKTPLLKFLNKVKMSKQQTKKYL